MFIPRNNEILPLPLWRHRVKVKVNIYVAILHEERFISNIHLEAEFNRQYVDFFNIQLIYPGILTFRRRASCILGQAFHYSPEKAFYVFNQQIYFII